MKIFGLDRRRLHSLEKTALAVLSLLTFIVFLVSLLDVGRYAGIDFRNRVVGARVLLTGQDPYTFEWQPGIPLELLDPCHDPLVHRLTAPPPTLLLYAAIAPLPYKAQRLVSFYLEWLALFVSALLLARSIADHRQRVLFLAMAMVFFALSGFWRMHVERGQVYVFHLLVLSAAVAQSLRHNLNSWSGGVLFGVAALMRLNYLLIAPAFLILRQWKTGAGAACTFVVGALATLPLMHHDSWRSYLQVGDQYYLTIWDPDRLPTRPPPDYRGPVEGVDFANHLNDVTSTSFAFLYETWRKAGGLPVLDVGRVSKGFMGVLALTLFGLLLRRRNDPLPPRLTLALILTFALDTEFFLPHRWGYVDVVLLLPVGLLWPFLWQNRASSHLAFGLLLAAFIAGMSLASHLSLYYASLLRSWLVMGSLTGLATETWLQRSAETRKLASGGRESPEPVPWQRNYVFPGP
jgi:hypothetical protein